jgi:adenylate cyclase
LAIFVKAVPKASAIVGLLLNLMLLGICVVLFRYFGLLADAASIFIILSAVLGSFFSTSLIENEAQKKEAAAYTGAREEGEDRAGDSPGQESSR